MQSTLSTPKPETFRKSCLKFWPEVMTEDEQNIDTQEIIKELQTLEPNVPTNEFENWIKCNKDCETYEELYDGQIDTAGEC